MVEVLGARIAGRFLVESRAATGGMGVVYAGRDLDTDERVAIKMLQRRDPESLARFEREAAVLSDLVHPAIVRYVAHGVDGNAPYLVMDWVDGETLSARLDRAPLSVADAVSAIARVATALGHAHDRQIVHRDVKPSNVIVPGRDLARVAVLDFGVARADTGAGSLTETGAMIGTPSYMAPEQARGDRDIGPAADVFSLGCVLYECITGQRAFDGRHVLALLAKVALWEPPRARALDPDLAPELDELIDRMLAKQPEQRPRDGHEVAALLTNLPIDPRPARPRKSRAKTPSTLIATPTELASIVVAADPKSVDEVTFVPRAREDIEMPAGVRVEHVRDGSLIAVATRNNAAERALAAARAIRRVRPDYLIVVVSGLVNVADSGAITNAVGVLGERAVAALAKEAMALLFVGVAAAARPAGAIRVDDKTAELLGPSAVVRVGTAAYAGGT